MSAGDANTPAAIKASHLLIGEGTEEKLFFQALLQHLGIHDTVQVEDYKGKGELSAYLKTLKTRPNFTSLVKLGITQDADDDPTNTQISVNDVVRRMAFPKSLGVTSFILPGQNQIGALENLCLQSVEGQPINGCIETYMQCASMTTGKPHTSTSNKAKARIHAWLAAQNPPDLRLGMAAAKGLINWKHDAFNNLKAFLLDMAR